MVYSLCPSPSLHLLFPSEHANFYFIFFPHFSQDNAWDYDPAAQVWGCRDSGGCSYYCHWGGSGKAPHFSRNASSDSTNLQHMHSPFPQASRVYIHGHFETTGNLQIHNGLMSAWLTFISLKRVHLVQMYLIDSTVPKPFTWHCR